MARFWDYERDPNREQLPTARRGGYKGTMFERMRREAPRTAAFLEASNAYDPAGPGPAPGYFPESDRPGRLFRESLTPANEPRETSMNAKQTAAELRELIKKAQAELAHLEKLPGEPVEKMTSFTVRFPGSMKPYVYVALRVEGARWLVSGRHFGPGIRWTWEGIFKRFDEIHATVDYMSTPVEYRTERISR